MSQEMNVLRCYSCKMYQVHIVKQAKKWQCKICNQKQTFRQVYFRGSGKDCRTCTQKLNLMKETESETNKCLYENDSKNDSSFASCSKQSEVVNVENKWQKYIDPSEDIQLETFNFLNNEDSSYEHNNEFVYLDNESATYEYLQSDSMNTCNNYYSEIDVEQDPCDDIEKHCNVEKPEIFDSTNSNDNDNQNYSKSIINTKCTQSIFDDNEDLDLAFDF